jgi:hypothetical protein
MAAHTLTAAPAPSRTARAIVCGALTVAVLDMLDAIVFFGFRGATPLQCFQGVASGFLGREAYRGGLATAALGGVIHVFISFVVVFVYHLASKRLLLLTLRPVPCGLLYGMAVHVFMRYGVIPLSAVPVGRFSWAGLANGLIGHALLVGLPAALAVSWGRKGSPSP